jgi:hypothetical protein
MVMNYIDFLEGKLYFNIFSKWSIFFLISIITTPGFIDWTVLSLMETGLWCGLLTLTVLKIISFKSDYSSNRHEGILIVLYVLLLLSRPESMLLVPLFITLNAVKRSFELGSVQTSLKWGALSLFAFFITLALIVLWRLKNFGYPLPNTFYAKVSSSSVDNLVAGIKYLFWFFVQKPFVLLVIFYSGFVVIVNKKMVSLKSKLSLSILLTVFLVSLAIPLYSGGDHFGLHRMLVPFLPILFLLSVELIKDLSYFKGKWSMTLILFLFFLSNEYNYRNLLIDKQSPIKHEWTIAVQGRENSEKLNRFFKNSPYLPSQGVLTAGGSAYAYCGHTIDLLGLNNSVMAHASKEKDRNLPKNHASFNVDAFFELSPDLFWYHADL